MSEIWFTSDTHFNHHKEFLYGPRGFTNPQEMGEQIVTLWNERVKPDDTVYHLGDFIFGAPDSSDFSATLPLIRQLQGHIVLIRGNHDSDKKINVLLNEHIIGFWVWAYMITKGKHKIYMSHYPTLTANFDDKAFIQHVIALHGHTHQTSNFLQADNPFMYHVGVDSHSCAPVHIDEMLSDVRNRWDGITQLNPRVEDLYFTDRKRELDERYNEIFAKLHRETSFA